jgi:DNA-binding response OmpR family regulator
MAQTILVADDEASIIEMLQYNLEKAGYEVVAAADGLEALRAAHRHSPDLAVLDITMPGMDGLELCGRLRLEKNLPVILLTARDSEIDKIVGLEIGADDYVTKPFSPRELIARVKAVLRRAKTAGETPLPRLQAGALCLDVRCHEARLHEQVLPLTAKEFCLLEYLMRNAGIALTRHAILDHVWGYDFYGDARTVDVHIRRLREKVEPNPAAPTFILTVPGVGYKFTTEV